jgi:putative transposase
MTNIRRHYLPKRPVFITAVCVKRKPFLKSAGSKELILSVMREVKTEKPFSMVAFSIMDDHFHWIINPVDADFSKIVQSVKLRFVHRYKKRAGISESFQIWQKGFWDHVIRDENDLHRHMDYVHYNPVKHGCVKRPRDYSWCSFNQHVERGNYLLDWGVVKEPDSLSKMNLE